MTRIIALFSSIAVAVLTIGIVVMARNLVMPLAEAQSKGVGAGPWFLVWGMIAIAAVSSAVLILFLVSTLRNTRP